MSVSNVGRLCDPRVDRKVVPREGVRSGVPRECVAAVVSFVSVVMILSCNLRGSTVPDPVFSTMRCGDDRGAHTKDGTVGQCISRKGDVGFEVECGVEGSSCSGCMIVARVW